jgi:hypothetical protein
MRSAAIQPSREERPSSLLPWIMAILFAVALLLVCAASTQV